MDRSLDWMRQALRDLSKVDSDIAAGYPEWACSTAQQAAEKAIKAVLQRQHAYAWGHSLTFLLRAIHQGPEIPAEVAAAAQRLDQYYVPTRYPDGFAAGCPQDYYNEQQAREARKDAQTVIEFCQGLLS